MPKSKQAESTASNVLNWDDVLKSTGTQAKRKGLASFNGEQVILKDFRDEQKGRKNVRMVMSATAQSGDRQIRIIVPQRYASRLRDALIASNGAGLQIRAMVEATPRGAFLKPILSDGTTAPAEPATEATPDAMAEVRSHSRRTRESQEAIPQESAV